MIGRKKPNSLELRPLPPDSHVARTRSPDNKRLLIVRQS
jgi:deferrochelatase/peroxidase EfeB